MCAVAVQDPRRRPTLDHVAAHPFLRAATAAPVALPARPRSALLAMDEPSCLPDSSSTRGVMYRPSSVSLQDTHPLAASVPHFAMSVPPSRRWHRAVRVARHSSMPVDASATCAMCGGDSGSSGGGRSSHDERSDGLPVGGAHGHRLAQSWSGPWRSMHPPPPPGAAGRAQWREHTPPQRLHRPTTARASTPAPAGAGSESCEALSAAAAHGSLVPAPRQHLPARHAALQRSASIGAAVGGGSSRCDSGPAGRQPAPDPALLTAATAAAAPPSELLTAHLPPFQHRGPRASVTLTPEGQLRLLFADSGVALRVHPDGQAIHATAAAGRGDVPDGAAQWVRLSAAHVPSQWRAFVAYASRVLDTMRSARAKVRQRASASPRPCSVADAAAPVRRW